jgi:RNA polymerase sigma-70 factor (ECF subfamily)
LKAIAAFPQQQVENLEGWLFKIAHNAAVDFLRRRKRQDALRSEVDPDMMIDGTASPEGRDAAAAGLRTFMHLPVPQRACLILMDVLGYSSQEVGYATGMSAPAVKAALHRGRIRIRELVEQADDIVLPVLSQEDLRRLSGYVERFNARDFDGIRNMLADHVQLELVARTRLKGRQQVSVYFHNYSAVQDWRFVPGLVDRRPALLVVDPKDPAATPGYFVLLEWCGERVVGIRDFRHARYVAESAEMIILSSAAAPSGQPES